MRTKTSALLSVFAFGLPLLAQTEGQVPKPKADVEKLWRIEATGLGG